MKIIKLSLLLLLCLFPLSGYEFAIGTMFRNCEQTLEEWITYHRMIGVDHFWLYNDESTDRSLAILEPYVKEGLVEVFPWPATKPFWGTAQRYAIRNALKRAVESKTRWLALIDADEFLLPREEGTITECMKKHFESASAVYVNWRNFGTNHVTFEKNDSILFRLTACSRRGYPRNWIGKSIVRPECVETGKINYVHHVPLKDSFYHYHDGNGNRMQMVNNKVKTVSYVSDKFLRINHYPLLDEDYFFNVRIPRDKSIGRGNDSMKWYEAFNVEQDAEIIQFISKFYPREFEKFWSKKTR